jgi:hypothetical protein
MIFVFRKARIKAVSDPLVRSSDEGIDVDFLSGLKAEDSYGSQADSTAPPGSGISSRTCDGDQARIP